MTAPDEFFHAAGLSKEEYQQALDADDNEDDVWLEDAYQRGRVDALREAAEDWANDARAVMFNKAGDNLFPGQRVGKWLRERADAIEKEASE